MTVLIEPPSLIVLVEPPSSLPPLTDKATVAALQEAGDGVSTPAGGNDVPEAAATPGAVNPPWPWVLCAFGILAVGTALSYLVWRLVKPADFMPSSSFALYAGLFIMALAIERVLEPFAGRCVPAMAKGRKATRAVLMWATGSVLAMLLCASLGIFLMRSVETPSATSGSSTSTSVTSSAASPGENPNRLLDLLVTGLVVGAGTKPLHDLIGQIQTSSGHSKPSASSATSTG